METATVTNYTFTKKETNRELWEAMSFVIKARAKADTRYAINGVLVEPGKIIATDSHRLHIAKVEHKLEPGLYDVLKSTRSEIILASGKEGNFPKWRDVVPACDKKLRVHPLGYPDNLTMPALVQYALAQEGRLVNGAYLDDTVGDIIQFVSDEPSKPIKISDDSETLVAVIMPADLPKVTPLK